jgi:hypothetical protein
MIALDTTALSALFIPGTKLCRAGTTIPIKHGKERLEALVERIAGEREAILIPTPVLSELLVCIPPDRIAEFLTQLGASIWFRVESFDTAAAVELGIRTAKAIAAGDKREGAPADTPWTKVKFDRQIIAIALVNGASEIISDDPHVKAIGERWGIKVTSVEDLPLPSDLIPPPLLAGLEAEAASTEGSTQSPEADSLHEIAKMDLSNDL